MKYFAYGSNLSFARLLKRVPCAKRLGTFFLEKHDLQFHKIGTDGTGKCDAYYTGISSDCVIGILYEFDPALKGALDQAESLGYGYGEKLVSVMDEDGHIEQAFTYYAIKIDSTLVPYKWYKFHVLVGAWEAEFPQWYIKKIAAVHAIDDLDKGREARQLEIYSS
ncbi:gamma-glutamylcyclotransferase [Endozoicomonas sp. Mp262]|uniref:gamma-glutamylcyclotransferase family protein n=1 Tax=Endozoicomonas sp. Mp262 TaxID=2919499 RepID=UPI0021D9CC2E